MTSNDPNATAAESAIQQIGTEFRRLRALRGERIEDIATYLDIKATYLFGIEQGDLSIVPSKREAKAIVRSYADYLGLDGEGIIGPMDPIIASLDGDKAPPAPKGPGWFDRTSAIILTSAVLAGILVGWSWIGDVNRFDLITPPVTADSLDDEDIRSETSLQNGELLADLGSEALSGDLSDAANATLLEELKIALADSESELDGQSGDNEPVLEAVDAPEPKKEERPANVLAALVAERGDGAHIYEAENTDARVIVRALAGVSVQVTSRSRDYVWTRSMKPREMLLVPNRDDLELWTADASGIEILLDGVILPPLGPPSTVISGLSLSASSLEALSDTVAEGGAKKPTF
ncbi:MAG: helix-turn-helix transcriptional regulator [Pseudomonadota bacterium]